MTPEEERDLIKSVGFIEGTIKGICQKSEDHDDALKDLEAVSSANKVAIAELQIKSGIFGVLGGILATSAVMLKDKFL